MKAVDESLDDYEPTKAGRMIDEFVCDNLSNWYVRINRKRFWGKEMDNDKLAAFQTLYTCLETVAKLIAPFAPFYADRLYLDLAKATGRATADSVHLESFPKSDGYEDTELEAQMEMSQKISSMVLALRRKVNIKVKQPLQRIMIPAIDEQQRQRIEAVADTILNEVNVKQLEFAEEEGLLVKKVKCNFRTMGKKYGKLMKGVAAAMGELDQSQIAKLENDGQLQIVVDGQNLVIDAADVEIISEDIPGWLVANEGNLTVALEVQLTESLKKEGLARELINRIQNIRKDTGLEITDRIDVTIEPNKAIAEACEEFGDFVMTQVLADSIAFAPNDGVEVAFDDVTLKIKVEKTK